MQRGPEVYGQCMGMVIVLSAHHAMQRGPEVYGQCVGMVIVLSAHHAMQRGPEVHPWSVDSAWCMDTAMREHLNERSCKAVGDGMFLVRCHAIDKSSRVADCIAPGMATHMHGQWEVFCVRISNERSFDKLSCMPERTLGRGNAEALRAMECSFCVATHPARQ
jgi:hypothetical protein